jgi:hypothetical protein
LDASSIGVLFSMYSGTQFAVVCFHLTHRANCREENNMENLKRVKELAKDLLRDEPRTSSDELAGEPHAARTLDKCRAALVGWQGDFQFGCPMDQHFFADTGIDMQAFKDFVATGADDGVVESWIRQHTRTPRNRAS